MFSKGCFSGFITSDCDRGKSLLQRDEECLKTSVISGILVPSAVADSDHRLNTPLWKTPFGQHRSLLLGPWNSGLRVQLQAVKVPIFGRFPLHLGTQLTRQPPPSSCKGNLFVRVRFGGVLNTVEEVVQVRICCLLSWKTSMGNTGWTVLGHRPTNGAIRNCYLNLFWQRIGANSWNLGPMDSNHQLSAIWST